MSKFAALALAVDEPARMVIIDPVSGRPMLAADGREGYIDVYSSDSEIARKHYRKTGQSRLDEMARRKKRASVSIETFEQNDLDLLTKLTAGWLLVAPDGTIIDVPFSPENARELYSDPGMAWLRDQVDEFAAERSNFSKASPKT